jgi:hypothetical protein
MFLCDFIKNTFVNKFWLLLLNCLHKEYLTYAFLRSLHEIIISVVIARLCLLATLNFNRKNFNDLTENIKIPLLYFHVFKSVHYRVLYSLNSLRAISSSAFTFALPLKDDSY